MVQNVLDVSGLCCVTSKNKDAVMSQFRYANLSAYVQL